ncbi:flavodoxin family protein [Proteiniclasticum sp. BAD-10]|uniref:Flavodoxin family protein n=1 Tax=Proteiniclasticum sediminis TaxID=2804028 RepID=A0A941HQ72_9CLOT|nr:flavodoxin family protein [Proteiniclasticum sediminis]MBR0575158.1 flavodoxin family protein [Proteiniclasticum sediminis]
MKVIAFNGSPKKEGNTAQALKVVLAEMEKAGIETEIIHVGAKELRQCTACGMCARNKNEECILNQDDVNLWIQKMKEADGILLGSPVHYSGISASMKAFLDRAFYVASNNAGLFRHKVGASLAVVRRSGGVPAFDALNRYIQYSEMIMPSSNYWNVIHGTRPGDIHSDEEGLQILRVLGKNMTWLLQVLEEGKKKYPAPEREKKAVTNFIR